ncbi:DUF3099 domain-containing protein [Solicola gregarius]|uniref:DUF3099 domain-containing protein n=1 Tax=Solicola gregarius TaxID=2908642 RepID=A0AA46TH00_9ACTN|nr:DUF3099 domain-containing protein [Solicola gregarius]UYM04971.1 DUF3099 domain-containing protein [Solicola gregarius]
MDPHAHQAVNITSAQPGRSVDLHKRQMRYLISMGIRTVCFVAAVIASGPLRWGFVVAAVLLPYVAVILANTATQRTTSSGQAYRPDPAGSLESGTQGDAK